MCPFCTSMCAYSRDLGPMASDLGPHLPKSDMSVYGRTYGHPMPLMYLYVRIVRVSSMAGI
jgi:hypothetical protein